MSTELPYAEDVPYYKTSKSSPDTWIAKARTEIERADGIVTGEAFGQETTSGRAAFMLAFELAGESFKIIWPVLRTKEDNPGAAKRQAATILYHDVKARCMTARILGARAAFFSYLVLPDGRTAGTLASPELLEAVPAMMTGSRQLTDGGKGT